MNENLEYNIFEENVTPRKMAIVSCEISNSKDFEIDELSHIVLKGTNTRIGYLGDDTFEIVNPNKKEFIEYHDKLKRIFDYLPRFRIN